MQKKRYYLDTSVWAGIDDDRVEFHTRWFFKTVLSSRSVCLYSRVVREEMTRRSKFSQRFFNSVWPRELMGQVNITPEVQKLADMYISEGVIGKGSRDDCLHVAAATIYKVDVLISWDIEDIVSDHMVKEYNFVNVGLGYQILEIRSPDKEVEYG